MLNNFVVLLLVAGSCMHEVVDEEPYRLSPCSPLSSDSETAVPIPGKARKEGLPPYSRKQLNRLQVEGEIAKILKIPWKLRGLPPSLKGGLPEWRGQGWRKGSKRYANPGGKNRLWHKGFSRAKRNGQLASFLKQCPHPKEVAAQLQTKQPRRPPTPPRRPPKQPSRPESTSQSSQPCRPSPPTPPTPPSRPMSTSQSSQLRRHPTPPRRPMSTSQSRQPCRPLLNRRPKIPTAPGRKTLQATKLNRRPLMFPTSPRSQSRSPMLNRRPMCPQNPPEQTFETLEARFHKLIENNRRFNEIAEIAGKLRDSENQIVRNTSRDRHETVLPNRYRPKRAKCSRSAREED